MRYAQSACGNFHTCLDTAALHIFKWLMNPASLRRGLIYQTGKYTKHRFIQGKFGKFQFKSSLWINVGGIHTLRSGLRDHGNCCLWNVISYPKIQRIFKIYKGKIFPHQFSIFTPQNDLSGKIYFRGSNPEVQTLL